ncbi:NAD(P)/FAD-dependent oxidoreductase [Meridianimarinicoccus sp. MJW13]|uniref:flavin-containing monooxygenase n=1 Tax=Meridianimarinicoccus sp. MJW13 TaxID=2720031 RepID=UPI001868754B|nr:NAD(P)/FAD-dependent oxidoreductase [Fluviibacterium sp. MJW13]
MPTAADLDIAVIGAGFSGIAAAIALKDAGRQRFAVFERAAGVGGVWRDNIYPGCRCDVPSQLYELAARPNPGWSRNFAPQPEILAYLRQVSAEPGLADHFRFGHDVTEARFDAAKGLWRLKIFGRAAVTARALIVAFGPLSRPRIPNIPGRESYGGLQLHSARWGPGADFAGKRVAVIGTGASAIQIVPEIARDAEQLYVVQRSPAWILPRGERRFTAAERALYRRLPALHRLGRAFHYWKLEFFGHAYLHKGLAYGALTGAARFKRWREVRDPELRRRLTPSDRIGCKRAVLSEDYLSTFNRPNVTLIDSALDRLDAAGVICADGRRADVDAVIWATGFHVTDPADLLPVVNAEGVELAGLWQREGPQAYRGTVVAGFPNFAYLLGPNGGLGHSSAVHFVESQLRYVLAYLDRLNTLTAPAALDLPRDRQDGYNAWVQAELANTVWGGAACNSWYVDAHGVNRAIFPGLCEDYRRHMLSFDGTDFNVQKF